SLFLTGSASYSAFTTYIVPGTGIGTIQAVVNAGSSGFSTLAPGQNISNGSLMFTLGSSSYACQGLAVCNLGMFFGNTGGRYILLSEHHETGIFTLGQPFTVGLSISQVVTVNPGEQAGLDVEGSFASLNFLDAAANPVTPTEVATPEPGMLFPAGL